MSSTGSQRSLGWDFAERLTDAQRRGGSGQSHQLAGIVARGCEAGSLARRYIGQRERRPLDLDKVHIGGVRDIRRRHGVGDCGGCEVYLPLPSDIPGVQRRRKGDPHRERLAGCWRGSGGGNEDDIMGRKHPLDAAGEDEGNALAHGCGALSNGVADHQGKRLGEVAAGVVVDQTVAVGFSDHGDDQRGIDEPSRIAPSRPETSAGSTNANLITSARMGNPGALRTS